MRVYFKNGKQREFFDKILNIVSVKKAAELCGLSERTIRDWHRGKFLADSKALEKLSQKTNLSFPPPGLNLEMIIGMLFLVHQLGGLAILKKYGRIGGDPEYRKKKWYEWWEKEGKYKKHSISSALKPINKPCFSKELAEFVGIVLGDGGITKRQIIITLHAEDDKEYSKFISRLIKELFKTSVGIYHDKKVQLLT